MFSWIWNVLFGFVPWYVWAGIGVALALVAWRFLGTKGMIAVLAGAGLFVVDQRARQQGRAREIAKQEAQRKEALERRVRINKEVASRTPEERRENLQKYVRTKK